MFLCGSGLYIISQKGRGKKESIIFLGTPGKCFPLLISITCFFKIKTVKKVRRYLFCYISNQKKRAEFISF
jgi:hypothetical protein